MKSKVIFFCVLLFCSKIVDSIPFPEELVRQEAYQPSNWPVNQNTPGQYHNNGFSRTQNDNAQINSAYQDENTQNYYGNQGLNYQRLGYNTNPSVLPTGPVKESSVNYDILANGQGFGQIPQGENHQSKINAYPLRPEESQVNFANQQYRNQNWPSQNQFVNSGPSGDVIPEREIPSVTAVPYRNPVQYPPFNYMTSPNSQYYQNDRVYPTSQQYQYPLVENSGDGRYIADSGSPGSIPLENLSKVNPVESTLGTRKSGGHRYKKRPVSHFGSNNPFELYSQAPAVIPVESSGNIRKIEHYGSNRGLGYPQPVNNYNDGTTVLTNTLVGKSGALRKIENYGSDSGQGHPLPENNYNDGTSVVTDTQAEKFGNLRKIENYGSDSELGYPQSVNNYNDGTSVVTDTLVKKFGDGGNVARSYDSGLSNSASINNNHNNGFVEISDTLTDNIGNNKYEEHYGLLSGPNNNAPIRKYKKGSIVNTMTDLGKFGNLDTYGTSSGTDNNVVINKHQKSSTDILTAIENSENVDDLRQVFSNGKIAPVNKKKEVSTILTDTSADIGTLEYAESYGWPSGPGNIAPVNNYNKMTKIVPDTLKKIDYHENLDVYKSSPSKDSNAPVRKHKNRPTITNTVPKIENSKNVDSYKQFSSVGNNAPHEHKKNSSVTIQILPEIGNLGNVDIDGTSSGKRNNAFVNKYKKRRPTVITEKFGNHRNVENSGSNLESNYFAPVNYYKDFPAIQRGIIPKSENGNLDNDRTDSSIIPPKPAVVTDILPGNYENSKDDTGLKSVAPINYDDGISVLTDTSEEKPENYKFSNSNKNVNRPNKPVLVNNDNETPIAPTDSIVENSDNIKLDINASNNPVSSDNTNPKNNVYHEIFAGGHRYNFKDVVTHPQIKNLMSKSTKRFVMVHPNGTVTYIDDLNPIDQNPENYLFVKPNGVFRDRPNYDTKPAANVPSKDASTSKPDDGQISSLNFTLPVNDNDNLKLISESLIPNNYDGSSSSTTTSTIVPDIDITSSPSSTQNTTNIDQPILVTSNESSTVFINLNSEDDIKTKNDNITISPIDLITDKVSNILQANIASPVKEIESMEIHTLKKPKLESTAEVENPVKNIGSIEIVVFKKPETTKEFNVSDGTVKNKKQSDQEEIWSDIITADTKNNDSDDLHKHLTTTSGDIPIKDISSDTIYYNNNIQRNNQQNETHNDTTPDTNTTILDEEQKYLDRTSAPRSSNTPINDNISDDTVNIANHPKYINEQDEVHIDAILPVKKSRRRKPSRKYRKKSTTTEAPCTSNKPINDISDDSVNLENGAQPNYQNDEIQNDATTSSTETSNSDKIHKYSTTTTAPSSSETPNNQEDEIQNDATTSSTPASDSDKIHKYSTTTTAPSSSETPNNQEDEIQNDATTSSTPASDSDKIHKYSTTTTAPSSSETPNNQEDEIQNDATTSSTGASDSDKIHKYSTTTIAPTSSVTPIDQGDEIQNDATTSSTGASDSDKIHKYLTTTQPPSSSETTINESKNIEKLIDDETDFGKHDIQKTADNLDVSTTAPAKHDDNPHITVSSSIESHANTDDTSTSSGPFEDVDLTISFNTTSDNGGDTLTITIEGVEDISEDSGKLEIDIDTTGSHDKNTKTKLPNKTIKKGGNIKKESTKDDSHGINLQMDLSNINEKPTVWFTTTNQDIVDKITSDNETECSVIYLFQMQPLPSVEKEKHTTIYPNGTVIIETTETVWENKDDPYPKVVKTTRVVQLEDLESHNA